MSNLLRCYRLLIVVGLAIAVVIAVASAWLASSAPDGLNRVAEDQGFSEQAKDPGVEVLPGYEIPGLSGPLSRALAGVIGVVIVAALSLGAGALLRARREHPQPPTEGSTAPPPPASSSSPPAARGRRS